MLLNQRQLEIILELFEKPCSFLTANYFSNKHQCSLRTIQNDIKQIKQDLEDQECVAFETVTRKGCRIIITDEDAFKDLKESYGRQIGINPANYPNGRITQLLQLLLNESRAISLYNLEDRMFVSRSTLLLDLKAAGNIIAKYNLEILRSSNKVMIDGNEIHKRLCIIDQNLLMVDTVSVSMPMEAPLNKLKNILIESYISIKKAVTDAALNNAIAQLYISVRRMQDWFFIAPSELTITEDLNPELSLSRLVYEKISREFLIQVPDSEIEYFALYLKGQGGFLTSDIISPEIDQLVLNALEEIRDKHKIDLTDNLNLRIALGIHTSSLVLRIKYDMQLKNKMLDYIRQTFPQGVELGIYFAEYLQKVFHKKVTDDEIAYLAIHLYSALAGMHHTSDIRRILVISSLRQSETILLKQTLLNWFSDITTEITIKAASLVTEDDLDAFDIFLTTDQNNRFFELGLAFYISPFPTEQEHINVKLAVDGFQSIDDITSLFYKDLYRVRFDRDRKDIIDDMCELSSNFIGIDLHDFKTEVYGRENMRSTYWGNGIAVPHPLTALTQDSFVAVSVLPNSPVWDDKNNKANLALMVCIGKNSQKAFQLWNYLSNVFSDKYFTERLLSNPSYDNFIVLLKETISKSFL